MSLLRRGLLREHASLLNLVFRTADILMIAGSALLAHALRFDDLSLGLHEQVAVLLGVLVSLSLFGRLGLYRSWREGRMRDEMRLVLLGWAGSFGVLTVLSFVLKVGPDYSRAWIALWGGIGGGLLLASRAALRAFLHHIRRLGFNTRSVVVVGQGDTARDVSRFLLANPMLGLRVEAAFCADADRGWVPETVSSVLDAAELGEYLRHKAVDEVWIAIPFSERERLQALIAELRLCSANIRYVADLFSFELLNHSVSEVGGFPIFNLSVSPTEGYAGYAKRVEDVVLAVLMLLVASPLLLGVALAIKLGSPGPVLFRQRRVGWSGREFTVYKFRSMTVHHEPEGAVTQASRNDPRVTPIGRWLRSTSIDELPQLLNVLKGDMSLVGPRPHALEHHQQYAELIPAYTYRHLVKPGLTGWAQIHGLRGETETLDKMRLRVEYDTEYIRRWSLWLDLRIIALTIPALLSKKNAY